MLKNQLARNVGCVLAAVGLAWGSASAHASWELRVCADPKQMPFSSDAGLGFHYLIAEMLADEMMADLTVVWRPLEQMEAVRDESLWTGDCDMIVGIPDGEEGFLTTLAFYRASYSIVYRSDRGIAVASLDDASLAGLRVGVLGAPVLAVLRQFGMGDNVVSWETSTPYGSPDRLGNVVAAVLRGDVDVAVAWGPIAGYYGMQHDELTVVPITVEVYPPLILMVTSVTIGVRPDDESLRDQLNVALARRWDDIRRVLDDHGVPPVALPQPRGGRF